MINRYVLFADEDECLTYGSDNIIYTFNYINDLVELDVKKLPTNSNKELFDCYEIYDRLTESMIIDNHSEDFTQIIEGEWDYSIEIIINVFIEYLKMLEILRIKGE